MRAAAMVPATVKARVAAVFAPAPAEITAKLASAPLPGAMLLLAWIEIIACAIRIELRNSI
jgi:hypothetical protein